MPKEMACLIYELFLIIPMIGTRNSKLSAQSDTPIATKYSYKILINSSPLRFLKSSASSLP